MYHKWEIFTSVKEDCCDNILRKVQFREKIPVPEWNILRGSEFYDSIVLPQQRHTAGEPVYLFPGTTQRNTQIA